MSDLTDPFLHSPFDTRVETVEDFDNLLGDAKTMEEEIEALKWMARRKEMEWDCARQMIGKKKTDIKEVKKKINMVRTIHDLGPQLNIDSDDEDTPDEEDDDEDQDYFSDGESVPQNKDVLSFPMVVRGNDSDSDEDYSFRSDRKFVLTRRKRQAERGSSEITCGNCKKPPSFVCSCCKDQVYCSRLCQTKHWIKHSSKCVPYETQKNHFQLCPPKPPGDSGVIKLPLSVEDESENIHSISNSNEEDEDVSTRPVLRSSKCLNCEKEDPKFICSSFDVNPNAIYGTLQTKNWYCSEECQEQHWKAYKKSLEQ